MISLGGISLWSGAVAGLGAADSFVVSPGWGAFVGMALIPCAIVGLGVTISKGRWGWALVGLLTGGLLWLGTGFLAPAPGSAWGRLRGRREA